MFRHREPSSLILLIATCAMLVGVLDWTLPDFSSISLSRDLLLAAIVSLLWLIYRRVDSIELTLRVGRDWSR